MMKVKMAFLYLMDISQKMRYIPGVFPVMKMYFDVFILKKKIVFGCFTNDD